MIQVPFSALTYVNWMTQMANNLDQPSQYLSHYRPVSKF